MVGSRARDEGDDEDICRLQVQDRKEEAGQSTQLHRRLDAGEARCDAERWTVSSGTTGVSGEVGDGWRRRGLDHDFEQSVRACSLNSENRKQEPPPQLGLHKSVLKFALRCQSSPSAYQFC